MVVAFYGKAVWCGYRQGHNHMCIVNQEKVTFFGITLHRLKIALILCIINLHNRWNLTLLWSH